MERQPNTEYILSLSYGKDSLACLEAIRQLGYPLDRIIHAEVWATDTIPADLPPMVEFKKKADKIILDRYGIQVEHICAMRSREREREREQASSSSSTKQLIEEETKDASTDSRLPSGLGVTHDLKSECFPQLQEKVTYEKLFYHIPKRRRGGGKMGRNTNRIPIPPSTLVQFGTQSQSAQSIQFSDFQSFEEYGATVTSRNDPYRGFPVSINRGNWCTQLKQRVFR